MGAGIDGWGKLFFEKYTVMYITGVFCSVNSLGFNFKTTLFQVDVLTPNEIWNFASVISILIIHMCIYYYMRITFLILSNNKQASHIKNVTKSL